MMISFKYILIIINLISVFDIFVDSIPLDGKTNSNFYQSTKKQINSGKSTNNYLDNTNNIDEYGGFEPLQVLCEINGFNIPAIIDTGAQITVMSSSCARRCRVANQIDCRYSGRAIGVGSSEIIGRINNLPMRIGPIQFNGKVSILNNARVDFLIGIDFLRRFKCDICLTEGIIKLKLKEKTIRVQLISDRSASDNNYEDCDNDVYNSESYDNDINSLENLDNNLNDESKYDDNDIRTPLSVYSCKSRVHDKDQISSENIHSDDDNEDADDYSDVSLSMEGV